MLDRSRTPKSSIPVLEKKKSKGQTISQVCSEFLYRYLPYPLSQWLDHGYIIQPTQNVMSTEPRALAATKGETVCCTLLLITHLTKP